MKKELRRISIQNIGNIKIAIVGNWNEETRNGRKRS